MSIVNVSEKERDFLRELGNKLKCTRELSNYSQATIANNSGCSKDHISEVEQGEARFTVYQMMVYCRALHITPNDLLGYEDIILSDRELQLLYKYGLHVRICKRC